MQTPSTHKTSPVKRAVFATFRQRCATALMHPVTLGALGVLLVNDLLFKAMWPGAWIPGKLSDLAWMMFATLGSAQVRRAAFAAAYVGLPLLYVAFNTFQPVHDVVLRVLGSIGGDGPRSPLDPTDSLVIPFSMAAALWVWRRPLLNARAVRARLALLASVAAALASVATSYDTDWGVRHVGRTASGTLGAHASLSTYESVDGGFTWTKTSDNYLPLEGQEWSQLEVKDPP